MKKNPDFTPIITCDITLGQMVEDIDADSDYFAELTRDRVSNGRIQKAPPHHIHFSSAYAPGITESTHTYGNHDYSTNKTTIFLGSVKRYIDNRKNPSNGKPLDLPEAERLATRLTSEAAIHESSHSIDATNLGPKRRMREVETYHDKHAALPFAAKVLLKGLRMSGDHSESARIMLEANFYSQRDPFSEYLEEPWEKRARETTENQIQLCDLRGSYPVEVIFKHSSVDHDVT